ncbi:hypothetical protein ACSFCX_24035 [Yokenella regensburgei]|uniref:hypothetical protein n=1 Tax=Yokenella regensburgei TaxID=158877 RepID=UPI003EDABAFA
MGKVQLRTKKAADWTIEEISIETEQLYYLLQTIAENYYKMEDSQRFSLIEIAWNFSGDVNAWLNAEEKRRE